MTAEDAVAENTVGLGVPDPAQVGLGPALRLRQARPRAGAWSGSATASAGPNQIPPQALITSPEWFAPLNVDQQEAVDDRGPAVGEPRRRTTPTGSSGRRGSSRPRPSSATSRRLNQHRARIDGVLGHDRPRRGARRARRAAVGGGATTDPTAPAQGPGRQGPERARLHGARGRHRRQGNRGEDRKVLFAYRDHDPAPGYRAGPRHRRRGVPAPVRPERRQQAGHRAGRLERRAAASCDAGRHAARRASTAASRCARRPTPTSTPALRLRQRSRPRARCCARPAIGDIDGDLEPEIVDSAGEHVYAWNADGSAVPGFPVRLDPALSLPQDRTRNNHIKRGFIASPDARRPGRGRQARDRRPRARPARLRVGRQRQPARRLPAQARGPGHRRRRDHQHGGAGRHHRRRAARHRQPDAEFDDNPVVPRRRPAAARRAASATSSRTSWPTRSAAAAASTRWTATATSCPAGRRSRTASCPTPCRSSARAWTTCWATSTATPSSR